MDGHVFGLPIMKKSNKLDLSNFNRVIDINYKDGYAEIEGSVYVCQVLDKLVKQGWIIQIPVDMYHLTFAGLIAGVGGGSASFRYGFIHETILEMDVLTANGECESATLEISSQGLGRINFKVDDYDVTYWLVATTTVD